MSLVAFELANPTSVVPPKHLTVSVGNYGCQVHQVLLSMADDLGHLMQDFVLKLQKSGRGVDCPFVRMFHRLLRNLRENTHAKCFGS